MVFLGIVVVGLQRQAQARRSTRRRACRSRTKRRDDRAIRASQRRAKDERFHQRFLGRLYRADHGGQHHRLRGAACRCCSTKRVSRASRRTPPVIPGTRTSANGTTRCRAGGCGCSTSPSFSAWSTSRSIRGSALTPARSAGARGSNTTTSKSRPAQYGPIFDKYLKQDIKVVAADPERAPSASACSSTIARNATARMPAAARAFPTCATATGSTAASPKPSRTTITNGRNGVMPPLGSALGGDERRQGRRALRVVSVGRTHDELRALRRRRKFSGHLRRLPWRRRQGQPGAGRAQPDRQHLAVRRFGGDDHRDHHQGAATAADACRRTKDLARRRQDPPARRLRLFGCRSREEASKAERCGRLRPQPWQPGIAGEPKLAHGQFAGRGRTLRSPAHDLSARGARLVRELARRAGAAHAAGVLRHALAARGTAARRCCSISPRASSTSSAWCSGRRISSTSPRC